MDSPNNKKNITVINEMNLDEKWYSTFERLKQWIVEKKKKPSQHAKDSEEKTLGIWIAHQQKKLQK